MDARSPAVCPACSGALVLTWPVVEMGINDDWSYSAIAWDFARTGRMVYHGWVSPIIGWQAVWGAAAVRAFGFSYTVTRLSVWPIALAVVALFHAVLRSFGLNRSHATLGTLTLGLSPLFLPLADTFMTDIPSLFVVLLCLHMCQRALAATSDRSATLWLSAAIVSNVALGTVRQLAWLGFLVIVPSCVYRLRRSRSLVITTSLVWIAGLASALSILRWFNHQPYTSSEKLLPSHIPASALHNLTTRFWEAILTTLLFCLPVLIAGLGRIRSMTTARRKVAAVFTLCLVLLAVFQPSRRVMLRKAPPWLGNTVGFHGILQGGGLIGPAHEIPHAWRIGSLALLVLATVMFGYALWERGHLRLQERYGAIAVLLLPYVAVYGVLLIPRAVEFVMYDRYMLEMIVVALVFLLRLHQDRLAASVPLISYVTLTIFAVLAVAGTHDLFSLDRARVMAFDNLQRQGIPVTAIDGGLELDGTTQIQAWGYVNDSRIMLPRLKPARGSGLGCTIFFEAFAPAIHARYVLNVDDNPCASGDRIAAVAYRTWLPRETHYVVTTETSGAPAQSMR